MRLLSLILGTPDRTPDRTLADLDRIRRAGDLILLSPHTADLLDFVVERRTTCSLVTAAVVPPRSEDARLKAWSESAAGAWVDERMDEMGPEDAHEPSVEPDREATPSAVPLDPVPSVVSQPTAASSSIFRPSPVPTHSPPTFNPFNPYSRPPAPPPPPPPHHPAAFDLSSRFAPVPAHVKQEPAPWAGYAEGPHSIFGEGTPLEPATRRTDDDGVFDFGQWCASLLVVCLSREKADVEGSRNDPDEVLKFLGVSGPTRPSSPNAHHHDGFDIDLVGRWEARGVVVGGEWGWAQEMV